MGHVLPGRLVVGLAACLAIAACGRGPAPGGVVSSGKQAIPLENVPAEVLQAARLARPDLRIEAAEHEVRDGRDYYDLEGTLPDGSVLELDMTRVDGAWTVVETQRDIVLEQVPAEVVQVLAAAHPAWTPHRIIESVQGDGVIIYEFFGPGAEGRDRKAEVKWHDGVAELLAEEWLH